MLGRETTSRFHNALETVTVTGGEITQLANEARHALHQLGLSREDAAATLDDVKTAAQSATIAFVIVSTVAVAALAMAAVALSRVR